MIKTPRYSQNKPKTSDRNPHDAPFMPTWEQEVDNEKYFEGMTTLFSKEQIADFKRIHSYIQFREYCEKEDLNLLF